MLSIFVYIRFLGFVLSVFIDIRRQTQKQWTHVYYIYNASRISWSLVLEHHFLLSRWGCRLSHARLTSPCACCVLRNIPFRKFCKCTPTGTTPAVPALSLADVELLLVTVVVEPAVSTTVQRAFFDGHAVLVREVVVRFTWKPELTPYVSVWKRSHVVVANANKIALITCYNKSLIKIHIMWEHVYGVGLCPVIILPRMQ